MYTGTSYEQNGEWGLKENLKLTICLQMLTNKAIKIPSSFTLDTELASPST